MKLRASAAVCLTLALLLGGAAPAFAWANGPDGYNSYGTHDWIVKKAVKAAGAPWVHMRVALRASDDPDSQDGIDYASGTWWHVWDEWGDTYGGAPEAAQHWFERIQAARRAGDNRRASRFLGYLGHIVGDVANPMHTDQRDREDSIHSSYESAVDSRLSSYRFTYDGRGEARPYRRTRAVARGAHGYYFELIRSYDRRGYDEKVHDITKRQLNRAANAMADLISSLR